VVILIETGLRSVDCLRLPFDPVTTDEAGASYLKFFNHKLSREAIIPISERLVAQIRAQQQDLRERFAQPPPFLLPALRENPDGERPFLWSALNNRLRRWLVVKEHLQSGQVAAAPRRRDGERVHVRAVVLQQRARDLSRAGGQCVALGKPGGEGPRQPSPVTWWQW
jgi:integrase